MGKKRIGNIGIRYLAYMIDTVIYCTLALVIWFIASGREDAVLTSFLPRRNLLLLFTVISFVMGVIFECILHASPGKKVCSLETVSSDKDRYYAGFTDILSRNLIKNIIFSALALFEHIWFILIVLLMIYGLIPLFTDRHRALHDMPAHTLVARERVSFGADIEENIGADMAKYIPGYYVVFLNGVFSGNRVPWQPNLTIGKNRENTIVLPETAEGVSDSQCMIYYDEENSSFAVYDMGSLHGTYLPQRNRVIRQGETSFLNPGEPVQAGKEVFCIMYVA